jgi:hypothetical protein
MKTTSIFRRAFLSTVVLSAVLAFSSCSQDSDTVANDTNSYLAQAQSKPKPEVVADEAAFALKLRVRQDGQDITTKSLMKSAKLFVFNAQNEFIKTIPVDASAIYSGNPIEFLLPGEDKVTVIAWGGLDEAQMNVSDARVISDLTLSLKQNNGIASTPSDLLYGQATLTASQTKGGDYTTLFVERKVSQLQLYVSDVIAKLGSAEGDFYFVVRQTGNSFDHQGNMTGGQVEYTLPATVNAKGNLSLDKIPVLANSDVEIEVYKNDVMIISTKSVKNAGTISLEAGSLHFVKMSLLKQSCSATTTAWGATIAI